MVGTPSRARPPAAVAGPAGPDPARSGSGVSTDSGCSSSTTVSSPAGIRTRARIPPYGEGSTWQEKPYCRASLPTTANPVRGGLPSSVSSTSVGPASSRRARRSWSSSIPMPLSSTITIAPRPPCWRVTGTSVSGCE